MIVAASRTALRDALRPWRQAGERVALVPTMGALHDGHLELVRAARGAGADRVAVSIFVNPRQFDDAKDLARYPVDRARDLSLLDDAGADLAWTPDVGDIYPAGSATSLHVGGPSAGFEGAERPGHFDGVATVVSILFGAVQPDEAWFGEKDWQQLQVVRRMVLDLAMTVSIRATQTARAVDGLALSSRNRFLDPAQRTRAPMLFRVLQDVATCLSQGGVAAEATRDGLAALTDAGFHVDYLALVRGETMETLDRAERGARLLAAVRLGTVRLLDNVAVD